MRGVSRDPEITDGFTDDIRIKQSSLLFQKSIGTCKIVRTYENKQEKEFTWKASSAQGLIGDVDLGWARTFTNSEAAGQ